MLTSFEVMQAANISRATLNNYISLGLLPRPLVKNPEPGATTSARQIGYFPQEVLARLERISQLKKEGYAMADIARQLELDGFPMLGTTHAHETSASHAPYAESSTPSATAGNKNVPQTVAAAKSNLLRLTIDHIPYPAYMVNYNFEITWFNEEARTELLGSFEHLPADIKERNALTYLLKGRLGRDGANREELLQFYLLLGKGRFSRNDLMNILTGQADATPKQREESLAELRPNGTLVQLPLICGWKTMRLPTTTSMLPITAKESCSSIFHVMPRAKACWGCWSGVMRLSATC